MAKSSFSLDNFAVRLVAAVFLVFATFNPLAPYSYFYWAVSPLLVDFDSFSVVKGLVGVVLIIGWSIFLRATVRALGAFGLLLAAAFFGLLMWWFVDIGWIGLENSNAVVWLVLVALSCVLATGLSWSHIRRRMSGQLHVDETDD